MLLSSYFKFLFRSTNQHGIHSPFIYSLVTKCFYDKKEYPAYKLLQDYRKKLWSNQNLIKVTDFGAGSRVFTSEERKISAIAKNAGITPKYSQILYRLTNYLNVQDAIELGTSLGLSTVAIAANQKVTVTTLEGCPETAQIAKEHFALFGLENIDVKVGKFEDVLEEAVKSEREKEGKREKGKVEDFPNKKPQTTNHQSQIPNPQSPINELLKTDLIYFDGNHQKEATLTYFEKLLPLAHNDSVFIFDDIHWSREMEEAWEIIKVHPSVKISVDTFQWGIIFFRKEQEKAHFWIRV